MIHLHSQPYSLADSSTSPKTSAGHAYFHLPDDTRDQEMCIYRLSERGSIHQTVLGWDDHSEFWKPRITWSEKVQELAQTSALPDTTGNLRMQENSLVDMWPIYEGSCLLNFICILPLNTISDVFIHHEEQRKEEEDQSADATYELVDQASMYWQTTEAPAENILTS